MPVGARMQYVKFIKYLFAVTALVFVAGCKEVLYSDLTEIDANEMVAILAASDIASARTRDKDGIYALSVDETHVAEAVVLLRKEGYPKEKFQSLGDVFNSDGIIGTPFEQHARFIHAMNEELSETLSSISGVRSAKVLTNAPLPGRYERDVPASTASVTIHYENGFDAAGNISNFKRLVASAVPNLEYENVVVTTFKAGGIIMMAPPVASAKPALTGDQIQPIKMGVFTKFPLSLQDMAQLISILAFLAAALLASNLLRKRDRKSD